jgi:hypothetical protein
MVGGGVPGKVAGIAHGTTTKGGPTIIEFHLFTHGYPQAGEMTTGIIAGTGMSGTTNEYLTNKFKKIGRAGNKTGIGRSNRRGESRVCRPERGQNNRLEMCTHNSPDHKKKRSNQSSRNNSNMRRVHNPERANNSIRSNMENTKKVRSSNTG